MVYANVRSFTIPLVGVAANAMIMLNEYPRLLGQLSTH